MIRARQSNNKDTFEDKPFQGRGPSTDEWRSFKKNFVVEVDGKPVKKNTAKTNDELIQYIRDSKDTVDTMHERDQQDRDKIVHDLIDKAYKEDRKKKGSQ